MEMKQLLIKINLFMILFIFGCGDSNRLSQSELPTPEIIYTPGEVVSDMDGFIQYYVGNTPIIVTVPHDGNLVPTTISERTGVIKKAENTLGIAQYFYNSFTNNSTGLYPHMIINNINRSRLDPDENIEIGAQNNYASSYYNRYHDYIDVAIDSIQANYGIGLLINLTAHENDDNDLIELGYLLSKDDLDNSDSNLESFSSQSSINAISSMSDSQFSESIRGFDSIGKKIMDLNCCKPIYYTFDVTPSPQFPTPQSEGYNSGGYTVSKYASSNVNINMGTIEFATPYYGHRDSPYAYIALGTMLVTSAEHFFALSTGISLGVN